MGTSTKILIGALITALLGWLTYGAMCAASGNLGSSSAASGSSAASTDGAATADGAASSAGAAAAAPATAQAVAACQGDINALMGSKTISFQSGSAYIGGDSQAVIAELADQIKKCAGLQIEVQGHTSLTGGAETNQNISQARAQNVVDALVKAGVPAVQLTAKGYGSSQPLENAQTTAANAKNQRTVLVVTSAAPVPTGGQ
ncbi:OmpA family protein [Sphingorhabdus arenilitoris]|uniref:OmpA family protein n=1 Tax=Sphingorhabdus arenilitoris TaxID=1490041 RepID=A0ABV8RIT8_9SPHN